MKKIFKNKIIYLSIAAIFLGAVACKDSFLEQPVTGQITEEQLLTQKGLDGLLIGVYSVMNGRDASAAWHAGASNWMWGSIRGGDANKGTNSGDFSSMNPVERFETDPNNTEVLGKWRGCYEGIARANQILYMIPKATDVSESALKRIAAETRFLRGHYYFELKKNFNMVPWVDETTNYPSELADKEIADKKSIPNNTDIWPNIQADFQFAFDNLPETQSQVGRANKWAAGAYLGKCLLFQKKYGEAKTIFDQVIANGQTSDGKKYALYPNFNQLFRFANENSAESVFAYQATGKAQNVNNSNQDMAMNYPYNVLPGNCCGFFAPSFELASSYRTNAAGLPLLDGSYRLPANELKNDQGLKSDAAFTPDAGPVDPRLDITIGRRGIDFLDWGPHAGYSWIRDQSYAGPYTPKKYTYAKAETSTLDGSGWTPGYLAVNFMIIRYADVLLMAAECEVEAGVLEKAREYVNMIRDRASNPSGFVGAGVTYKIEPYPASDFDTQEKARARVQFERKLELALEGHRFYDLVRWGIAEETLNTYLEYESAKIPSHFLGAAFAPKHEILPIPQREIDLHGNNTLKQNTGF
ncbi:RagB/SusD family nutrient uptake outer membrane protein [Xanthocytophaga flava]|uniref:RagB/SusD family nutrient uptake outer membrane protein n=1 Tax=Xanthocytophaga flava TaxID=3048013 RepID=UPI0028D0EF2D|nr:RagB/SusD family nutrient uptake outer membrane protein [Xanthocytophaga flavus]MDJ1467354.1 RagB/SusD family nutrient uptake outer membrane protein [Xanthocytophaga flavus]